MTIDKMITPRTARATILVVDIAATHNATRVSLPRNGYIRNISAVYEGTCKFEMVMVTNGKLVSSFNRLLEKVAYPDDTTDLADPYSKPGRLKDFSLNMLDGTQGLTGANSHLDVRVTTHTRLVVEFWHLGV